MKRRWQPFTKFRKQPIRRVWVYQTAWALFNLGRKDEASKTVEEFLRKYPEDPGGVVYSVAAMLAAAGGNEMKAEEIDKAGSRTGEGIHPLSSHRV